MHHFMTNRTMFFTTFPLKKGGIFYPTCGLRCCTVSKTVATWILWLGDLGSRLADFALVAERLRSDITAHSVDFLDGFFAVVELFGNQLENLEVLRPFAVKVVATTSWSSRR